MNSERNFGSLKFDQFCIEMPGGFKSEIIFQEIIMLQRLQRAKQWGNQSYYNLRWCSNFNTILNSNFDITFQVQLVFECNLCILISLNKIAFSAN